MLQTILDSLLVYLILVPCISISPLLAMAWVTDGRPDMRSLPVLMASQHWLMLRILGWFIGQLMLGDDQVL